MIQIINPHNCCGCTACVSICTHDAIVMKPDSLGFLYPEIDKCKCTNCGLCETVCSFHANYDKSLNLPESVAYGARHKDIHEIETSQSGAAFIALSDWILEQGGVVYGVGYADHFRVVHKRALTKKERNEFKGSKYVQSDLSTIYCQIKEDLKAGLIVLFSGTPCQTSGLNSYIGKHLREKLYLVDVICHGVGAPFIWRDYLNYLEKREGKCLSSVNFRDKSKAGWHSHVESFCFENMNTYTYEYTFYTNVMHRHSCSVCPFTNLRRPSDITIGDFWGVEKIDSKFATDNNGCSLVLLNTAKGKEWFKQIKDVLNLISVDLESCLQPNLMYPTKSHPSRMNFELDYMMNGFVYVMKLYGNVGWWNKIRLFLRKFEINII